MIQHHNEETEKILGSSEEHEGQGNYSKERQSKMERKIGQDKITAKAIVKVMGKTVIVSALIVIVLALIRALLHGIGPNTHLLSRTMFEVDSPPFPKILWIYTQNEVDAEQMLAEVCINYHNYTFPKHNYQVRFANSWTAYDWLSPITIQRITRAMHNSQVDSSVHPFLKLALLQQHGGILMSTFDYFVIGKDMTWIQHLFQQNKQYQQTYVCDPREAQIFIQKAEKNSGFNSTYQQGFVAALPRSKIISESFEICEDLFLFGTVPQNQEFHLVTPDMDTKALTVHNPFETCLNIAMHRRQKLNKENKTCLGIQQLKHPYRYRIQQNTQNLMKVFVEPEWVQTLSQPHIQMITAKLMWPLLANYLADILTDKKKVTNQTLLYEILNVSGNRQIFIEQLPEREVEFCVIALGEMKEKSIQKMKDMLKKQTYKQWTLVVPVANPQQLDNFGDSRVKVMAVKSTQVHTIEQATIKECNTKAYAVLLNENQEFNDTTALEVIAGQLKPRNVMGAVIGLNQQQEYLKPDSMIFSFSRVRDGIVSPNIKRMDSILNHLRIFSIEAFRYIPQFDLRDIFGKYFKDRLIFLMSLIEMIQNPARSNQALFWSKKYAHIWNLPSEKVVVNSTIAINIQQLEQVDQDQIQRTKTRIECESIEQTLKNLINNKIPFKKILVLNPGNDFVPVSSKTGPDIIPKIIHQTWLGSTLPPAKEYFVKKAKVMYPDYEVKLWREENLTKENFPLTYDILQNIFKYNKKAPYNKLATATDVMRHQLLYREGGFWKDAGMNLLRPIFNQFRKYKIVLPVDKTFRFRWLQGMCFFANTPKNENMWRITNFRNLNRMRIYERDALKIGGPVDFRQFVSGEQEYNPEFLLMPYETFYPGQLGQHPLGDICLKRYDNLKNNDTYIFVDNGWYLLSNCDQLYPYAFAIEHNHFGNTWQKRKEEVDFVF